MRYEQQLKTFLRILDSYAGDMPLARFLPGFFRENRQMGSTDRKTASRLLYNYFRMGKAALNLLPQERLFFGEFLCNDTSSPFLEYFRPELNDKIGLSPTDKIGLLESGDYDFRLKEVFPYTSHLSAGVDPTVFLTSFFIQPDLFIRIHPGKEKLVKAKLEGAGVKFTAEDGQALRLPNGTKLEQLFPQEKAFEVQDLSSQQTGDFFKPHKNDYWWDCCAASGGKSLLLFHQEPDIRLVVSDKRETVLSNLDGRFLTAGLKKYQKKVLDLTQNPQPFMHDYAFDGIILDAPCTGSGTWGRTPEMIGQFKESRIGNFQQLQRAIARNVIPYLKAGKPLVYITCSVFKEENEANVDYLVKEFGLVPEEQKIIRGYENKADTMFVARLLKTS